MDKNEQAFLDMIKRVASDINREQADRELRRRMSETVQAQTGRCRYCERLFLVMELNEHGVCEPCEMEGE